MAALHAALLSSTAIGTFPGLMFLPVASASKTRTVATRSSGYFDVWLPAPDLTASTRDMDDEARWFQ